MSENRKRNWVFVLYPESAPENWREQLRDMLVPGFISPLHDKDVNADGTPKKPHWHVILTFKGLKSYEQVKAITDKLNARLHKFAKILELMLDIYAIWIIRRRHNTNRRKLKTCAVQTILKIFVLLQIQIQL